MKYGNLARQRNLLICLALVAKGHSAMAGTTVVASNTGTVNSTADDVKIPFSTPVANADELLSISGGTVYGVESESFSVDVTFATGSSEQIYSSGVFQGNFDLDSIADKAITLPTPSDTVTGIEIFNDGISDVYVGSGTQFTFDTNPPVTSTTPEPSALTLLGTPLLAAPIFTLVRRRRRSSSSS
jgi:hypothetical protein